MNNHTPTPWKLLPPDQIRGPRQEFVADCQCFVKAGWRAEFDSANAEFIVRAVNNHEDLLAALEKALHSLTAARQRLNIDFEIPAEEAARAAITKAKGQA